MKVIPVINCPDIACARQKIEVLKKILHEGELVHLDISDGSFTPYRMWGDPMGWTSLAAPFGLEVHVMADHPEEHADDWFAAGARRLIVHVETITRQSLHKIVSAAERYRVEIVLSSKPDSDAEIFRPYIKNFSAFQVLAVEPGPAGQPFLPFVTDKIRFLRESAPDATIEVDGGMNPTTAQLVKDAGADVVVASNYIFAAADPKIAYEELIKI